jgi:hypothetical protein
MEYAFLVVQALLTLALIAVTWWYAVETKRIRKSSEASAREMKLTRERQVAPSIIAYFDNQTSNLIDLVIKNIGYGAAKDVGLKIAPPLLDFKDRPISELSLFRQGINFFPPNREFRQIVGTSSNFFSKDSQRPLEYKLTISYSNIFGRTIPDQIIPLDLSVYRDLPIHRGSAMDKLVEKVDKIATILEKE